MICPYMDVKFKRAPTSVGRGPPKGFFRDLKGRKESSTARCVDNDVRDRDDPQSHDTGVTPGNNATHSGVVGAVSEIGVPAQL